MNRKRIAIGVSTTAAVVAALGVMVAPAAGARARSHDTAFIVVASHLNNPRGLAPAPGGGFYLAEAGSGGTVCVKGGPTGTTCLGLTGSFDMVGNGGVKRLVTGLISASGTGGVGAEGPVSVSSTDGNFYGLFGLNTHVVPPKGAIPDNLRNKALAQLGRLWLIHPGGSVEHVSNVGDQDWAWTEDHINLAPTNFPDANPNTVLYSQGDRYVADAGSNILVEVEENGTAKVLAFFPVPAHSQSDSVPTCVARGPDGALYVTELLGGFYTPGHAVVWRVVPGYAPTVWATGLTTVQGCGFGSDGAFYATEFQTAGFSSANPAGDVVRISEDGQRTHLGVGKLFFPSGFLAAANGAIYVSNCSIAPATGMGPQLCPDGGQVVRIG